MRLKVRRSVLTSHLDSEVGTLPKFAIETESLDLANHTFLDDRKIPPSPLL